MWDWDAQFGTGMHNVGLGCTMWDRDAQFGTGMPGLGLGSVWDQESRGARSPWHKPSLGWRLQIQPVDPPWKGEVVTRSLPGVPWESCGRG